MLNLEALSNLNPERFTVEDASAVLRCPKWIVRMALGTGVRRGEFVRDGNYYKFVGSNDRL